VDPAGKTVRWILKKDANPTEALQEAGKDWAVVAALVEHRRRLQCHYRRGNFMWIQT
jgi:hypothetical protein